MRIILFCCVIVFLVSCTKSRFPDDIIQPEKMETVFRDIVRADILISEYTLKDSLSSSEKKSVLLQKKIFQAHGVTKEQFYKSFDYYAKHPNLMTALLDSSIATENRVKVKSKIKGITNYE